MARRRGKVLRGVSRHRSYTIHETAIALGVTRNTVVRWLRAGLPAVMDRKPFLILGQELIDFHSRRKSEKQHCRLSECYCFRCRTPRPPACGMADLIVGSGPTGMLRALCETCGNLMHKRLALRRTAELEAELDLAIRQAPSRIAG